MIEKATTIDLEKYLGIWNQLAAFPAWFQRGCSDVTATYKKVNEYISVFNACYNKNNVKSTAFGTAKPFSKNVLKVSFFPLVSADYIIEFVGVVNGKYEYAIVGSNGKKYLWILSRRKRVPKAIYDELVGIAKRKGYDVSRLVKG